MKRIILNYFPSRSILFLIGMFFSVPGTFAQTTGIVYSENFNSPSHGWVIGGYNPSWSYGIPSLPNINSNGTNCFVTGDAGVATNEPFTACLSVPGPTANGNYYNCCERSFVASPVIDLTGVNSPLLSIDINLHCEQSFDGAKLQLSVNGGNNWIDVGVYTSFVYQSFPSSLNCREQNWYNKNSISYLSNTGGGCGSVNFSFGGSNSGWSGGCAQGASGACSAADIHGTNGWVTATHCIPQAANKSSVKIRVVFGGGSQVYSDGIAFDNVQILDVYPVAAFTESVVAGCYPELNFINTTDCAAGFNWDFGHPGLPGNNSSAVNPSHVFPAAGNYTVSLLATDFCGGTKIISKPVVVPSGNGPVISGVESTSAGLCNSAVDSIKIELSAAGNAPYNVSWIFEGNQYSLSGVNGNPIIVSGLLPGVYEQITVNDDNGCAFVYPNTVNIPLINDGLTVNAGSDIGIEIGNQIQLQAVANLTSSFQWTPAGFLDDPLSESPVAFPNETTTFTVTATSINGCTVTDRVTVFVRDDNPCNNYFIPNSFTPNGDGKNDRFYFIADPSMRIATYNIKIFNRWGEKVYTSKTHTEGWDGSGASDGVYAVVIEITCVNKKSSYFSGKLSLIR